MPDYTAYLQGAQQNFIAAGPAAADPTQLLVQQAKFEEKLAQMDTGQEVMKCHGDYNKMPYGWRPSPFIGKCGFKIQMKNFYTADSPCYPIQDLSCMGPLQKKVWARMCKTEFPCKPLPPPVYPRPYRAPPGLFGKAAASGHSTWELVFKIFNDNILPIIGITAGCCLLFSVSSKKAEAIEPEPDVESEDDSSSVKPN
jgi:hypothetical protein